MNRSNRNSVTIALVALAMAACGGLPPRSTAPDSAPRESIAAQERGAALAQAAVDQIGAPYKYGGNDQRGFDCSGLVRFVHTQFGLAVPRTTLEQYRAATPVPEAQLQAGDLLFFKLTRAEVSHVGIYLGDGRFVHAPETGRQVEARKLDGYFRTRLIKFGRFH